MEYQCVRSWWFEVVSFVFKLNLTTLGRALRAPHGVLVRLHAYLRLSDNSTSNKRQKYWNQKDLRKPIYRRIVALPIFNAESLALATQKLATAVEKYSTSAPKLAAWMKASLPDGFTVFAFPEPIRQRLRTSNLCEMINKQIRRRTRVASIFPNEASCLRLVSAILMELSDEWESSNAYLNPQFLR